MVEQLETETPSLFELGIYLSVHGYNWFWVAFVFMLCSLLLVVALDLMRPRSIRLFHQIAVVVLATASLAYFSMAFDLSTAAQEAQIGVGEGEARVSYVWYIQWIINLPLLLLSVLLVTGLSLSEILVALFAAVSLVVCALVGDFGSDSSQWWSTRLGSVCLVYLWYVLLFQGSRSALAAGDAFSNRYLIVAGSLSILLLAYPLSWALAESADYATYLPRVAWYGILDCITQPLFLLFFLFQVNNIDRGSICGKIALQSEEDGWRRHDGRSVRSY